MIAERQRNSVVSDLQTHTLDQKTIYSSKTFDVLNKILYIQMHPAKSLIFFVSTSTTDSMLKEIKQEQIK